MTFVAGQDRFAQLAISLIVAPWFEDWAWGLPLIVLTVIIHVLGLQFINHRVERLHSACAWHNHHHLAVLAIVSTTVWLATVLHGIEAIIWAFAYRLIGALPDYDSAVLYSLNAMTTYGHEGVFLEKRWQLLGAMEALSGMLLFGLTTAFLIHILMRALGQHGGLGAPPSHP